MLCATFLDGLQDTLLIHYLRTQMEAMWKHLHILTDLSLYLTTSIRYARRRNDVVC